MRYRLWLSTIIAFCLLVVLIVRSRYDKPTETFVRPRIAEIPVPPAIEDEGQVITTSTAGPFQTLVLFVQEDGQNYEPAETIQVARPSVMGRFTKDGWRVLEKDEKPIEATRRTLFKRGRVEIRETVIENCETPVRVLEKIRTDTNGKRWIERQEMAPDHLIAKFHDEKREKSALSKLNAKVSKRFASGSVLIKLPLGLT